MRLRACDHPLQALSLVENAELVQVRFTLHSRDQWTKWLQDGCRVYMDFCKTSNGSCFMVTLFRNPPLGGRPNTKPGEHVIPNAHNRWFILYYHVWGLAWIEIHWNNIWLRTRSHMTSHYTWGTVTTLHDLGTAFEHFLLGSHNFMVTALGSCVKWPLVVKSFISFHEISRLVIEVTSRNTTPKVEPPKTNTDLKPTLCTTCIHLEHLMYAYGT